MRVEYRFPGGRRKVLTFSYDDGNRCDERLADIFSAANMKATFNLNGGWMAWNGKIHADELKRIFIDRGHEVACHGFTHPFENQIMPSSALEDILEDRKILEAATGRIITGMAYPYGTWNKKVLEILSAAGITYCRTVRNAPGTSYMPESDEWLTWHPTCHHSENILAKGEQLLNERWGLRMLYIWGHAFEFDQGNNWNIIEEFCDAMKDKPEIWYATNGEIHDYVEACRHLVSSADGTQIYNPSAIPVCVFANEKTYDIAPGETVKIK